MSKWLRKWFEVVWLELVGSGLGECWAPKLFQMSGPSVSKASSRITPEAFKPAPEVPPSSQGEGSTCWSMLCMHKWSVDTNASESTGWCAATTHTPPIYILYLPQRGKKAVILHRPGLQSSPPPPRKSCCWGSLCAARGKRGR